MQIEWDFPIGVNRGVELLLLSEMVNTPLIHQSLTSMGSSVSEMQRVVEYVESQCLDMAPHPLYWFLPQLTEGSRVEEVMSNGKHATSAAFGSLPEVRLHDSDHIYFRPGEDRVTPISTVSDLKPWRTTLSEVLHGLGEPLTRGDDWYITDTMEYEIPKSSGGTPERVRLTFTLELLEYLGPHRPDDADWRRYGQKLPSASE